MKPYLVRSGFTSWSANKERATWVCLKASSSIGIKARIDVSIRVRGIHFNYSWTFLRQKWAKSEKWKAVLTVLSHFNPTLNIMHLLFNFFYIGWAFFKHLKSPVILSCHCGIRNIRNLDIIKDSPLRYGIMFEIVAWNSNWTPFQGRFYKLRQRSLIQTRKFCSCDR